MNESIRIVFTREDREIPVDDASREGITLLGEISAWPRRTSIFLRPLSPGAKSGLSRVRQRLGKFGLTMKRMEAKGHVLLGGLPGDDENAPNENLPPGHWELGVNLYPMGISRAGRIEIPEDGQSPVVIRLAPEPGVIAPLDPDDWDSEIMRVLGASELDSHPQNEGERENGIDWASSDLRRARRRACLFNVLAVCRELDLIQEIRLVFFAEVDRVYAAVTPAFAARIDGARFHSEGTPSHPIHRRILDALEGAEPERWELRSFRQKRNPSLQVIVARERDVASSPVFAELDIDRGNPRNDLVGFFVHTGEVAHPGRTNHIRLRKALSELGAGPFLAYQSVRD